MSSSGLARAFDPDAAWCNRLKFLGGVLNGALEIGLEPTFERFNTQHQNFGGFGLHLRYNRCTFAGGLWFLGSTRRSLPAERICGSVELAMKPGSTVRS